MALILVRHGRTASNAEGRLLGRGDPELDEVGRAQAAALAAALGPLAPGTRLVSSPLARTRATAAFLAAGAEVGAAPQLEIELDERFIEVDYGSYEGVPLGDVEPEVWARWRSDLDFTPPGGESMRSVAVRVAAACAELLADAAERDVVVVSHVSPIKAATVWALGVPDETTWRLFVHPASVTTIAVGRDGRPTLTGFNETLLRR